MQKILPFLSLVLFISILPIISFAEDGVPIITEVRRETVRIQQTIDTLYKEGNSLYKAGKIESAKEKFKTILDINPLYEPARSKLRHILDTQSRMLRRDKINTTRDKILEVEKKWTTPVKKPVLEKGKVGAVRFKTEQQKLMEEKARQIVPEINFTDAHLRDVIQYLSRVSGINIILDEDIFVEQTKGELGIPVEVEVTKGKEEIYIPEPASVGPNVISDRVTISLKNIPLIEALKYILTSKGLKYRIDEYAIIVSTSQRLTEVEMETRYYHLVSGIGSFTEYLEPPALAAGEDQLEWEEETTEKKETTLNIKDVLEESGVPFLPGSKIFLDQRTGTLIIRNTPSNLAVVEDILRILDVTPYQIEIEARFVQMTADTAKELGLEWMITSNNFYFGRDRDLRLDSKTTNSVFGRYPDPLGLTGREGTTWGERFLEEKDVGTDDELNKIIDFASTTANNAIGNIFSLSGILTEPQFRMVLHAINQSGDAKLVSAPKVTTINNQRAQIEMIDEFIYPGEYEVTPPTVAGIYNRVYEETRSAGSDEAGTTKWTYKTETIGSSIITPGIAVPISFETRDVGIVLNVTPSVGSDRKTITLTLIPEVSEFLDWIDYGVKEGVGWNAVPIVKPIFQTRNVTTSVVIDDGETVVLGGLVKEELDKGEDKIPFLGDIPLIGSLFRTKREVSKKTNLVIFVTARLLTPSGDLVRETKEYAY